MERADDADATQKDKPRSKVSLFGFLNALDGGSSQEGQLLIMTTKHIEHLDEVLIRPGQVDGKVLFRPADKNTSVRLFCTIFTRTPEEGEF